MLGVADSTFFSLKTHISEKKRSQQIQTRDVDGPFEHICACICSPSKIAFCVGKLQYVLFVMNMPFISSNEVKIYIFHESRIKYIFSLDEKK